MRQAPHHHQWHIPIAASIGSALEYYAFITFILLADPLSHVFFPAGDPNTNILKTLAIFTIAYITAPVGSLIFGTISDRLGRKRVFIVSLWLMAGSATLMGLLPGYATVGIWGSLILVALRFLQGLAQGAEIAGGMVFVAEHSKDKQRGFHCGLMFMGIGLGASLATLISYLLHQFLTNQQIIAWAWRIPFLLSIVLGLVGYWLRRSVQESPAFLAEAHHPKFALWTLLKSHPVSLLQGMGLVIFGASLVTFGLLLPHFLHTQFHYPSHLVFLALTIAFSGNALFLPLFGWISDQWGRKRLYACMLIITLICLPLGMWMLSSHAITGLFIFVIGYYFLLTSLAANYVPMLTELFPTQYRFTGVGTAYTYCFTLAGFIPLLATWLIHITGSVYSVLDLLSALGVITLITLLTLKKHPFKA